MVSTLLTPTSFCFLVWRRPETGDRSEIGERQSGYISVSFSAFSHFTDSLLLHIWLNLRRVRHDRAAQVFNALYRMAPANLDVLHNLSSQMLSITTKPASCATLLCCACAEQPICVAVRYLTLRIGGYTARKARPCGRKNPLPFPCFAAVAVLRFSPCPPRETGVKRVETAGVYPLAPPAWVRRPRRAAKCFGTETLLVLTSYGQERKI